MIARRLLRTIGAWCAGMAIAVPAAAQAPSLHSIWISEVLDLDAEAAAAAYARLAADRQAPLREQLVATARCTELRRQGLRNTVPPPDLAIVPTVLRQHFEQSEPSPPLFDRELEAGRGDQAAVHQFFNSNEVPQLRPLVVATVLAAAELSNPSAAERMRQQRARFSPWTNDPARVLDYIRASEIVRAELDGRGDEAAGLRRRTFPNWRAPAWPPDVDAAWARVATNLGEWQRERQLISTERELLRRLQVALEQQAATDAAAALHWLDRMPLYAERLRVGVTMSGR